MNSNLICPIHNKQILAVSIDSKLKNKLVCIKCLKENNLSFSDYILIEDILDLNLSEILCSPEIRRYFNKDKLERFASIWKNDNLTKEIETCFTNLIDEVVLAINEAKDQLISSIGDGNVKKTIQEEAVSLFGLEKVVKSINESKLEEIEKVFSDAPFIKDIKTVALKVDKCFDKFSSHFKISKVLCDFQETKQIIITRIKDSFNVPLKFRNSVFSFNEKFLNLNVNSVYKRKEWFSNQHYSTATIGEPIKPNTGIYTIQLKFSNLDERFRTSLGIIQSNKLSLDKSQKWKLPNINFEVDKKFISNNNYSTQRSESFKYLIDFIFKMIYNSDKGTLKIKKSDDQLVYKGKITNSGYYQFFVTSKTGSVKIIYL